MDAGVLWQVGGALLASASVYGAIRADLRNMKERIATLESRLFEHITKGISHGNS